jgi:hypothetical protein
VTAIVEGSGAPPHASLSGLMPALIAVLLASAAVMWAAAGAGNRFLSLAAAGAFGTAIVLAALRTNMPMWRAAPPLGCTPQLQADAMRRNARLAALVYAWGAAALFAVYMLAGLAWRHGWQYGSGMALIAGAFLLYVHAMGPGSALREPRALLHAAVFTVLHGLGALAGLGFLLNAGKLATVKGDWAANHVFLAGGAAIVALCLLTLVTHVTLARRTANETAAPPAAA